MNFLRSKPEHLAEHLRDCIARGEIVEPLPNIRDWSERLGVAHGTLESAIGILKREGVLRTRPRKGVHIVRGPARARRLQQPPTVRCIFYGRHYRDVPTLTEIIGAISQRLTPHGIRFSLEMCNDARLRALHRQGERPHEMLLLSSMPKKYQELFSDFRRSVLLIGPPFPGIGLAFISNDVIPAFRHATYMLARRGFLRVSLLINESAGQPIDEEFRRICASAPQPIQGDVVRLPNELYEQNRAVQRLAARVVVRQGLITISPVPPGLIMMALMKRGVDVPGQVEVISVNTTSLEVRTFPLPIHYPFPMEKFAKTICQAAVHYFEQGSVPPLRKLLPLHVIEPPR
jgi:DNA-binding LacI/PurR family transcriptional regulator